MNINRVSLTLPRELLEKSDKIAKEKMEDRSTVMRELLNLGIREYMLNKSLYLYMEKKISLGKASEIANVSVWKFLDVLKDKKMPLHYDLEDIKREIDNIVNEWYSYDKIAKKRYWNNKKISILPTKATNENGNIKIGDILVSSSKKGYAMSDENKKLTINNKLIVGITLMPCSKQECIINVQH